LGTADLAVTRPVAYRSAQREQMGGVHAIAAKANVVVDLFVFSGLSHTQQQAAVDIANVILAKIKQ
jgi:hypothetical protein